IWSLQTKVRQAFPALFNPPLPGLPAMAWIAVAIGLLGLALRLWAVLTLRHRYTRTLLINDNHDLERGGPYRFVRHPGYLGSLMTLNGIAAASGSAPIVIVALIVTIAGYAIACMWKTRCSSPPWASATRPIAGRLAGCCRSCGNLM